MGAAAYDSLPGHRETPRPPERPGRPELRLVPTGPDVRSTTLPGRRVRSSRLALVLTVAVVAAVLLASWLARAGATPPVRRVVTVQAGQTLSHVAARELPDLPLGNAVAEIQLANRLNTAQVHAGQQLLIPEVG